MMLDVEARAKALFDREEVGRARARPTTSRYLTYCDLDPDVATSDPARLVMLRGRLMRVVEWHEISERERAEWRARVGSHGKDAHT